jgi:hypothetical protein
MEWLLFRSTGYSKAHQDAVVDVTFKYLTVDLARIVASYGRYADHEKFKRIVQKSLMSGKDVPYAYINTSHVQRYTWEGMIRIMLSQSTTPNAVEWRALIEFGQKWPTLVVSFDHLWDWMCGEYNVGIHNTLAGVTHHENMLRSDMLDRYVARMKEGKSPKRKLEKAAS